jgi:hypothetical protein
LGLAINQRRGVAAILLIRGVTAAASTAITTDTAMTNVQLAAVPFAAFMMA